MITLKIESIISPNIQIRNRHKYRNRNMSIQTEQLEKYELGKCYPDFYMLEPFIEEYNTDLALLKTGDIIIRDWQFGHMENTGYRPLKIVSPYNGMDIKVEDNNGIKHSIYVDYSLMKDRVFHKLDKTKLNK